MPTESRVEDHLIGAHYSLYGRLLRTRKIVTIYTDSSKVVLTSRSLGSEKLLVLLHQFPARQPAYAGECGEAEEMKTGRMLLTV
jgi:hypothetical protein